jgi:hypothetical protein
MRYVFVDERSVSDEELQREIEFGRARSIAVRTTDRVTLPAQEFASLRRLNEIMRKFWAEH